MFNHVRVNETPRDFWQDKSQHFTGDFTSIGPKVKQEKMGIKINPGYFGNKSQNVFSNPTEQTIIIRAWKNKMFQYKMEENTVLNYFLTKTNGGKTRKQQKLQIAFSKPKSAVEWPNSTIPKTAAFKIIWVAIKSIIVKNPQP